MRILFMGTPAFALPALKALAEKHEIVAVYTQPPKPAGRGHRLISSPVHEWAKAQGIPVETPKSLRHKKNQAVFQQYQADIAIVAAYGLLLPKEILESPTLGCLNIHGSLLPRWRGAAPIQYALLHGDTETGVTIMKMDEGMDTGPMLLKKTYPIPFGTTARQLFEDLALLGAQALMQALPAYEKGLLTPEAQDHALATLSPKIKKEEAAMPWEQDAKALLRRMYAFDIWPGCMSRYQDKIIKIKQATVLEQGGSYGVPGTILDKKMTIACGQGLLRLEKVQPQNKPIMSGQDFLNGHTSWIGQTFHRDP